MRELDRRLLAFALLTGLVLYGALAIGVYLGGSDAQPLGVLAFVVPIVLGFTFGAWPGAIAGSVPLLLLLPAEALRRRGDETASVSFTTEVIYVAFVAAMLGFVAWFCGSIRDRFLVGRTPPD